MKSANYVVLFENADIVRNLVHALRYVYNEEKMYHNW